MTKYNLWVVIDNNKIQIDGRIYLRCKCECGTIRNVIVKDLKPGVSKSCGCVQKNKTIDRSTMHGMRYTRVSRTRRAIKTRCYNKNIPQFKNSGGRGIKVCAEWMAFKNFYKDMGDPKDNMTLDRIDVNGNYEPSNCRWITMKEQMQNKTNNRKINGICITQISKNLGGANSLVARRIKRGWPINKAITTKSKKFNANI